MSDPFALMAQPLVDLEERYNARMFRIWVRLVRLAEALTS